MFESSLARTLATEQDPPMKKLLLVVSLLALLAAPSFAYVQSGQVLPNGTAGQGPDMQARSRKWIDGANDAPIITPLVTPAVDGPTRPIPEPGTMVLASLGLLALGVSRAKRRGH